MATQDYIEWKLPDDTVYRARGNIKFTEIQQPKEIAGGFSDFLSAVERVFHLGTDASPKSKASLSVGSGTRRFATVFEQWEGSSDQWGGVSTSTNAVTKMQIFADDMANQVFDSMSPLTLSFGEYSTAGSLTPLTVAPRNDLEYMYDVTDNPAVFTGRLEFVELVAASDVGHDLP